MAKDYMYLCTECHWHGSEDDLQTIFSRRGDEQVCPECGAFEQCIPQNDVRIIINEGKLISICHYTELQTYLNLGWTEKKDISIEDFISLTS